MKSSDIWMLWGFAKDSGFYSLLAILSFVPITALVASCRGITFVTSRNQTWEFLKSWIKPADDITLQRLKTATLTTSGLLFLLFLAYFLNRLGDAGLPRVAQSFSYLGESRIQWQNDYRAEWNSLVHDFRDMSKFVDRDDWEKAKAGLGKYDVRFFRIVFFLFLFLFVAGVIDVCRWKNFCQRGMAFLVIGFLGTASSLLVWTEREGNYVQNLVAGYQSLYKTANDNKLPELPFKCQDMVFGVPHKN